MSAHVQPGDRVMVRTADGKWIPGRAVSEVRIDHQNAPEGVEPWETVSVQVDGWEHPVNWPEPAVASL